MHNKGSMQKTANKAQTGTAAQQYPKQENNVHNFNNCTTTSSESKSHNQLHTLTQGQPRQESEAIWRGKKPASKRQRGINNDLTHVVRRGGPFCCPSHCSMEVLRVSVHVIQLHVFFQVCSSPQLLVSSLHLRQMWCYLGQFHKSTPPFSRKLTSCSLLWARSATDWFLLEVRPLVCLDCLWQTDTVDRRRPAGGVAPVIVCSFKSIIFN